ncbi:hypothetical protein GE09DRAFT_1277663 [Coniochaeta sp. 2T2.1]|nr:hypothetical protein GE09DRAFT_1277663 [Coniochaeta sp. 2T2.1]
MAPPWLPGLLVAILAVIRPVAAYNTSVNYLTDGGAQFIYYQGSITGNFAHNLTRYNYHRTNPKTGEPTYGCGDNGTYHFTLERAVDSYMRIGVNAPWDTNPFFFSLFRGVDGYRTRDRPLPEFEFATAHFECFKNGVPCDDLKLKPWEYVPQLEVDLNKASISAMKDGNLTDGPFYAVTGDERTYVGNGTLSRNRAHFQVPSNYSRYDNCVTEFEIIWSKDTTFTYALNFTNATALASVIATTPDGVLSIFFNGSREDQHNLGSFHEDYFSPAVPDPGDWRTEYHPIQLLNPADYPSPNFTFTDGKGFKWGTDHEGRWDARPLESGAVSRGGSGAAALVAIVAACLLWLC